MIVVRAHADSGTVEVTTHFSTPLMKLANGSMLLEARIRTTRHRSATQEHRILRVDHTPEVLSHHVIELGDELGRLLRHSIE